ncbi:kinetochore component CENP-S-domain-containing protein [Absidia repens]|uniref:Kinetochore component CENP-S-domain-containing protein n=1 Tax=Absidia repens TaxID=90262 RepID=A0A1X2ILA0_9FUNG|nr:kinetochore component CENP-S-domain-containing protein [Absidia repens]
MATSSDHIKALHLAVWATVSQIAQEEGISVSNNFIAALASVVFNHMVSFGLDVEAFASHGRRTVINSDDVLLCARRNEKLKELLSSALQNMANKRPTGKHVKE